MKKTFLFLLFALCCFSAEARYVGVFLYFADDGKQIYEDENVRVAIAMEKNQPCLAILNKTDRVIYLDKGSSFVYKNGTATCLFSNSAYSSGTGSTGGASVNLGGVAGALGIGGSAGNLLSGVNVGGGQSTHSSTTYYEQRVMAIAPKAFYKLYTWDVYHIELDNRKPRIKGRTWSYDLHNTPYVINASLRYSFDENLSAIQEASVYNYISNAVYDKASYARHGDLYTGTYCRQFDGRNGMCYTSGSRNGLLIGLGAFLIVDIAVVCATSN